MYTVMMYGYKTKQYYLLVWQRPLDQTIDPADKKTQHNVIYM